MFQMLKCNTFQEFKENNKECANNPSKIRDVLIKEIALECKSNI